MADSNINEIPTHTLTELSELLPKPDATTLTACTPDEDPQALVQRGAQIASSRVLVDTRRLYAQAYDFWTGATPEQQTLLIGFSPALLGAGVNRALALQERLESAALSGTATTGERAKLDHAARLAFSRGVALRDQAERVLRSAAGRGSALEKKVLAVTGTASDANELAAGLEALSNVGNEILGKDDKAVKTRVSLTRLSVEYTKGLGEAAKQVLSTAKAATIPRPAKAATQSELDLLDGVNLLILADIIRAFESAHDIDPTIPRLVPISTRRLLGKRTTRKAKESDTEVTPTTEPTTP